VAVAGVTRDHAGRRHTVAVVRVAVVLGAGGSVGHAFHAGVLGAIQEQLGWDARQADTLVGTSAGSAVSVLLRAGLSSRDLALRARGLPLSAEGQRVVERASLPPPGSMVPPRERASGASASPAALRRAMRMPWTVRPGSLAAAVLPAGRVTTHHMAGPFRALFGTTWPAMATWIVAVQLDTSRRVVFGRDTTAVPVADAVRASCAIPAFFAPVEIDGERYVDGGVHSTTNADLVGSRRPDLVLVSAPMSAARGAARGLELPMRQFARLSLAREVAGLRGRGIPVMVFHPTAADLEVMTGDALDQRKVAPVCERVLETVSARLARQDVTDRLGPLLV
jgi:NTE family protein